MSKVLVVTSSPRSESVSTYLAAEFANMLETGDIEIFDIAEIDFPVCDEKLLKEMENSSENASEDIKMYNEIMQKFIDADRIVFAYPNWNSMCPPNLIYYMLCVCRMGVTFKYTDHGSVGLLEDKKTLLILSCGGKYIENATFMGNSWLKGALALNGITNVQEVVAELIEVRRDEVDLIKEETLVKLKEVAKTFLD